MSVTSRKPRSTRGSCAECMYWNEAGDVGHCRRHAPQIVAAQMSIPPGVPPSVFRPDLGIFPVTTADDWCGEYLRK